MELQFDSDYGSGSSTGSIQSWLCGGQWTPLARPKSELFVQKSSSYIDLPQVSGKCTLDDVMREFRMNGSDSPYDPDEEKIRPRPAGEMSGMGPAAAYLRQKSWPAPERSPAQRLPRPRSMHDQRWDTFNFATSTPVFDEPAAPFIPESQSPPDLLSPEQARVLNTLPDSVLYTLLRGLQSERRNKLPQECRFCKNNGERESYYRSHALKARDGRVACPVLRAFVCGRCGARGDTAHTIKYCPLSTNEERIKSAAMMRSVRMASGRRRHSIAPSLATAVEAPPAAARGFRFGDAPLDPLWAALEQKLSL